MRLIFILNFIMVILLEAIGAGHHLWDLIKKKMLQHFPVSEFLSGIRGVANENLWHEFHQQLF